MVRKINAQNRSNSPFSCFISKLSDKQTDMAYEKDINANKYTDA